MRLSFRSELCRIVSRRAQVSSYIQAWWFRSSQTDLWKDKYSQALFRREVAQTNTAAGRDLPSVWATPFCLLVQMWVLFPRHIWMLVPGFSAQERRLVLENQQCGHSVSAAERDANSHLRKTVHTHLYWDLPEVTVSVVAEGKWKKKSKVFLQGIPRKFKRLHVSVHLPSKENDLFGMAVTLFLPELHILRCTRHSTSFLKWEKKSQLVWIF